MPTSEGRAANQNLPGNIRRFRERKEMSQAELAAEMTDRDWTWHQNTVYRVEAGKQEISYGEVKDIAAILGVRVMDLEWSGPEANAAALVDRTTWILHRDADEAADALMRLHAARSSAERALEEARRSKYPRVRERAEELEAELADATLENVIAAGEARWEQEREG